jgi:hypothetical protein
VNYVDLGYMSALGVLFVYAVGLTLRRRRQERALKASEADEGTAVATPHDQL